MKQILAFLGDSTNSRVEINFEIIEAHRLRIATFSSYIQEWVRCLGESENLKTRLDHSNLALEKSHYQLEKIKKILGIRILQFLFSKRSGKP